MKILDFRDFHKISVWIFFCYSKNMCTICLILRMLHLLTFPPNPRTCLPTFYSIMYFHPLIVHLVKDHIPICKLTTGSVSLSFSFSFMICFTSKSANSFSVGILLLRLHPPPKKKLHISTAKFVFSIIYFFTDKIDISRRRKIACLGE